MQISVEKFTQRDDRELCWLIYMSTCKNILTSFILIASASGFHKRHFKSVIKSKYHLWRLVKETINFDKMNTDSHGMQISAKKLTRW